MRQTKHHRIQSQRGAVLIVALVLLLVLTILGTAGIQDTTMEERMAGNFRDHSAAMQAAETALRTGEMGIGSSTAFGDMTFTSSGGGGFYNVELMTHSVDPDTAANWAGVDADVMAPADTNISANPNFYIEQLPEIQLPGSDLTVGYQNQPPPVQFYRVTGRGFGISPNSEVILQSTYFR